MFAIYKTGNKRTGSCKGTAERVGADKKMLLTGYR